MNLGNPDEISILDFATEIKEIMGSEQPISFKELPTDDPTQRQPDITKAKELLGWSPQFERKEGLRKTIEYFKSLAPEELYKKEHRTFNHQNKKK